jgi:hypothetical protein
VAFWKRCIPPAARNARENRQYAGVRARVGRIGVAPWRTASDSNTPDRRNWSVSFSKKEYPREEGRYRPLLLEPLAQASGGQDLPLADLTGCFVRGDRDAVRNQGLS